jgi:hypothetical protein
MVATRTDNGPNCKQSTSTECNEYEKYEKEFRKELQCSWRNDNHGHDDDHDEDTA